jgi:hypothetical protein
MRIGWIQVRAGRSGGFSMREPRGPGRLHRGEEGRNRPTPSGTRCRQRVRVATLLRGPTGDGALGGPESLHGTEFKHGLESA